jgi:hypothetical protein
MPKSKHRKDHKKKVEARRKRLESTKRTMQNKFMELFKQEINNLNNNKEEENLEENV